MSNCPPSELLQQRRIPAFAPPNDAVEAICKLPAKIPSMAASDIQSTYEFSPAEINETISPLYYTVSQEPTSSNASEAGDCVETTDVSSDSFTWVDWLTPITGIEGDRSWILAGESLNCTDNGDLSNSPTFKRPALPITQFSSVLPAPITAPISVASALGGGGGGGGTPPVIINGEEYKGFFKVIQPTDGDQTGSKAAVEVVDGANWYNEYCGYAVINSLKYDVKKDKVAISTGSDVVNYIYLSYILKHTTNTAGSSVPFLEVATKVLDDPEVIRVLLARVKAYNDKENKFVYEIVQEFTGAVLEYTNDDRYPIPAIVKDGDDINGYKVELYKNGFDQNYTGIAIAFLVQGNSQLQTIPYGTKLMVYPYNGMLDILG